MAYHYFIKGILRFNEEKVKEKLVGLMRRVTDEDIDVVCNDLRDDETASYCISVRQQSTTGVCVRCLWNGIIVVELPWLSSQVDVYLCYALLNAVKKTHRAAHIINKEEKGVKLNGEAMERQWLQNCVNMAEMLYRDERTVIAGLNRNWFVNPQRYAGTDNMDDKTRKAFDDFAKVQWTLSEARILMEEQRHVSDDEELSNVRVSDNNGDVFIGECRYVGMMNGNDCKMVLFDDFCTLMSGEEEFVLLDDAQACLCKMDEDKWLRLYNQAQGRVMHHFRKTFIMRWNTDISNYRIYEFRQAMNGFHNSAFYYEWSIWEYQKVHPGDKFYMIRTGGGRHGVVMHGTYIGQPYPDVDWSGKGRKVYYIRMQLDAMIDPDHAVRLLTTEQLGETIPAFNWTDGHSGEQLSDEHADSLEQMWEEYVSQLQTCMPDDDSILLK